MDTELESVLPMDQSDSTAEGDVPSDGIAQRTSLSEIQRYLTHPEILGE